MQTNVASASAHFGMCSRVAMFQQDNLKMTELPDGLKYADVWAAEPTSTSPIFCASGIPPYTSSMSFLKTNPLKRPPGWTLSPREDTRPPDFLNGLGMTRAVVKPTTVHTRSTRHSSSASVFKY